MKGGKAVMEKWLDDMYDLCETVAKEIGAANKKIEAAGGKLTGADVDYIDKITHAMKSIKATISMAEAEENGESGYYPYMGGYRSFDNGGMSNRRGGGMSNQRRDSRGRYSREYRGYSRDNAMADMVAELRGLMRDAPDEHTRMRFQRFIDEIENA
jgi:hypothetical protein